MYSLFFFLYFMSFLTQSSDDMNMVELRRGRQSWVIESAKSQGGERR